MPSRPRLMRPLFSVIVSPRLTKRNGAETRSAPPSTASGTPHQPMSLMPAEKSASGRKASRRENAEERHALQNEHRRVGQIKPPLQHPARRGDAAEEDRHRDDGEGILARDEGDQDPGVAVARDERRVGRAVHCGHLHHAGEAGGGAAQEACAITRRETGRPASCAARGLPPTMRSAKPHVVWRTSTYIAKQKTTPKASPQCTSV